jgi:hypothetical protein
MTFLLVGVFIASGIGFLAGKGCLPFLMKLLANPLSFLFKK